MRDHDPFRQLGIQGWRAEAGCRLLGLGVLTGGGWLALAERALILRPHGQDAAALFLACAAIHIALTCGLALVLFGPGLFRQVPLPVRSIYRHKLAAVDAASSPLDTQGVSGAKRSGWTSLSDNLTPIRHSTAAATG